MHQDKRSTDVFPIFVVCCGIGLGLTYHFRLWTLDVQGFSILMDRLPYWDFTNLWAGGALALQDKVQILFDPDGYRAALRAMLHPLLPDQEWSYPPSLLLIGMPLAKLPILPAYLVWTFSTVLMLWLAIRLFRFPRSVQIAIILSPAVFMNALFGQNGAFTAALLITGLMLTPSRPIMAGIAFGLLTIKPHLGILIPFVLIAGGHWRAFVSAAVTSVLLVVVTGSLLGFQVWSLFMTETRTLMTAIMEAPYPQHYHANAITGFILARSAGAGLTVAYLVQSMLTCIALATAIKIWLPSSHVHHTTRVVLTALCAILATPYGYTYDLIPLSVAVGWLFLRSDRPPLLVLAGFWLFPLFAHLPNYYGIGVGILPIIALCAVVACKAAQDMGKDPAALSA